MAEENIVRIVEWPEKPAKLEHAFQGGQPCPVSIFFEKTPANVILHGASEEPLQVNMNMNMHVTAREPVPICVQLCEPICAESDYTISIEVFDRPFAAISFKGMTRLFNWRDKG